LLVRKIYDIIYKEKGRKSMKNISKILIIILASISLFNIKTVEAKSYDLGISYQLFDDDSTNVNEDKEKNTDTDTGTVTYCNDPAIKKPLVFIGNIINIAKILLPLILIIFGVIDFFKAVISLKPEELGKSIKSLVMRTVAAVIIFFIPTIISLVFKLLDDWSLIKSEYTVCSTCLLEPKNCP